MSDHDRHSLVHARGLVKDFPVRVDTGGWWPRRRVLRAVEGVDLSVKRGETVGIIGESGSGKSTLGRLLLRLHFPTEGRLEFDGIDLLSLSGPELRRQRKRFQLVFQNPSSALNRRKTVIESIVEPMAVHALHDARQRRIRALELLELVGLAPIHADRYPHELSGGQLQRVGIARALGTEPELLVADEPTASLDVSIRAQIMNLLSDVREELDLSLVFISHDLSTVSYISDRVAVMYLGRVVESGPTRSVETRPLHPYTEALLAAVPRPDPGLRQDYVAPKGEVPSAIDRPSGCAYHPRCPLAMEVCLVDSPPLIDYGGHSVACHAVVRGEDGELGVHPHAGSAVGTLPIV